MKVVLIEPPKLVAATNHISTVVTPPLGLGYVAASTRAHGHDVSVIDAAGSAISTLTPYGPVHLRGLTQDRIVADIPRDVDVIGVGCMFSCQWPVVRSLVGALKRRFPHVPVVLGGEHPTGLPEFSLGQAPADFIVLGEGEYGFVDLLTALDRGGKVSGIPGIAFREGGGVVVAPRRPRITAVDDLPWPAWDLFPLEAYMEHNQPHGASHGRFMPMLATRGCPYECTFCTNPSMWTQRWIARDISAVIDEMETYVRRYDARDFQFEDLTAIVRKDWIRAFCEGILARGLRVTWQLPSGTRSEAIDRDIAGLMKAAGCDEFAYAPESGSPRTLKAIKKKVSLDRLFDSAKAAMDADINVGCFFIVGFPGETLKDIALTYRAIAKCAVRGFATVNVNAFSPQPGTELYRELLAQGRITHDDAYFYSLFTFQGPLQKKTSWNARIGDWTLTALVIGGYAVFFGVVLLRRPWRIAGAFVDVFRRRSSTKLGKYLRGMLRAASSVARARLGLTR